MSKRIKQDVRELEKQMEFQYDAKLIEDEDGDDSSGGSGRSVFEELLWEALMERIRAGHESQGWKVIHSPDANMGGNELGNDMQLMPHYLSQFPQFDGADPKMRQVPSMDNEVARRNLSLHLQHKLNKSLAFSPKPGAGGRRR